MEGEGLVRITIEAGETETWSDINEANEAASREELLNALREYHKKMAKTLKA